MGRARYKKFLDKKNILDEYILDLAENGKVNIGVILINKQKSVNLEEPNNS